MSAPPVRVRSQIFKKIFSGWGGWDWFIYEVSLYTEDKK